MKLCEINEMLNEAVENLCEAKKETYARYFVDEIWRELRKDAVKSLRSAVKTMDPSYSRFGEMDKATGQYSIRIKYTSDSGKPQYAAITVSPFGYTKEDGSWTVFIDGKPYFGGTHEDTGKFTKDPAKDLAAIKKSIVDTMKEFVDYVNMK